MNPVDALRRYEDEDEDNPGSDDTGDDGDLWGAITHCDRKIEAIDKRLAVTDERVRMVLWVVGFLVALQLLLLGVMLR